MRYWLCLLVCWFAFAVTASARMGETRAECMERYGLAVTNVPGFGDLASVGVYVKDDIVVSLFFIKTDGQAERVGMVIYSRAWPDIGPDTRRNERHNNILVSEITTNEQVALLATIPGRWEDYALPASALAGRSNKVIPLTDLTSPTEKNRDAASLAVRKAFRGLYAPRLRLLVNSAPQDIVHNGPKMFAFRISGGLALCSYDAVAAITTWAEHVLAERTKVNRLRKDDLRGF